MPILIDGHNLIGQLPTLSLADPDDEEKLVRLLSSYRARTRKRITVVFDPGVAFSVPQIRKVGGIEVVFAPHNSSADAVIARRVGASRNPDGWLVVTSDHGLADKVAGQGARVQSARSFAQQLSESPESEPDWKDTPVSPQEVEAWLDLFEGKEQKTTGEQT
jgi:predicted RNA-binding protein with PIN domain